MKYSSEVVRLANEAIELNRLKAQDGCEARKDRARASDSRFAAIEAAMAKAAADMTHGVIKKEGAAAVWRAKEIITALQVERAELLTAYKLPQNTYFVEYSCKLCDDTGASPRGGPCECYTAELKRQAFKSSVLATALSSQTFANFKLSCYSEVPDGNGKSPRERMERYISLCTKFIENFDSPGAGFLFTGPTGLGKTHLSSAIAGELAAAGYAVQYDMAANILQRLEGRRFGRTSDVDPDIYFNCDLLIMDDLGSEFATAMTTAELFTLINTRLITGRKTIISTNYTVKELDEKYTQKLLSRFLDGYTVLTFTGEDVRAQRRQGLVE